MYKRIQLEHQVVTGLTDTNIGINIKIKFIADNVINIIFLFIIHIFHPILICNFSFKLDSFQ